METGMHEYLFGKDGLVNSIVKYFRIADPKKIYGEDITVPQFFVLNNLAQRGALSMGQLSSALGVSHSTMTGIVGRLFKKGFVLRSYDKQDRRAVYVKPTAKVRDLIKIINKRMAIYVEKIFARLSLAEKREAAVMIKKLSDIINGLEEMK